MAAPLWFPTVSEHLGAAALSTRPAVLASYQEPVKNAVKARSNGWIPAPHVRQPRNGQVAAELSIPALRLKTPVVEGTADPLLLLAPGHFSGSVMPGEIGTSVIAAHNATYFRHLNRLTPGDQVIVTTGQGTFWFQVSGAQVFKDNGPLLNSTVPSLALEACWPLSALYFTPTRYVVNAFLVKDVLTPTALQAVGESDAALPPAQIDRWIASRWHLGIRYNSIPMGHLTYRAPATRAVFHYQESPAPLNVERDGVHLWTAFKDVSQAGDVQAVKSLFLHQHIAITGGNPYWDASSIAFEGVLNVALTLTATGKPQRMVLSDDLVRIDGNPFRVTAGAVLGPHGWAIKSVSFGSSQ